MEEKQNSLEKASNAITNAKDKGKNGFKTYINQISYILIVIITIFFSFAVIGFQNGFSIDLVMTLGVLIVINLTTMFIFIPQGEDNEKNKSKTYANNLEIWGNRTSEIENKKLLMKFRQYCEERTEELRQQIRNDYVMAAGIDIVFYKEHLQNVPIKELKKYKNPNELGIILTKKDIRLLKKAKGKIKVKPISYSKILAGSIGRHTSDALQEHAVSYKSKTLIIKVISMILYTLFIACAVIIPTGASGLQAIQDICLRILGITVSTVMGFYTGVNSIRIANSDIKEKILFQDEFLEKYDR